MGETDVVGEGSGAEEGKAAVECSTCTVLYTHTEGPEPQALSWHLRSVTSVRRPCRARSYDTSAVERSQWPHLLQGG